MPNQYIFKKAMLNDLAAQLEQHSDDCEPLSILIMQRFIKYVEDFPAADVQPVKRGRWVHDGNGHDERDNWYHCSECKRTINIICGKKLEDYPYCHCGARMDGDTK